MPKICDWMLNEKYENQLLGIVLSYLHFVSKSITGIKREKVEHHQNLHINPDLESRSTIYLYLEAFELRLT